MRDAVFGDARRIIENLLNDRALVTDDEPARPLETIYHARPRQVDTLFGVVELRRCYYYHTRAHTGRHPLDEALDLVRGHTPGLARMISRAATHSGSYDEAEADLHTYLGINLKSRNFGRLVAEITPALLAAQATLPPAPVAATIPILYVASDGTGVPLRRSELVDVKGKQPDGTARTREAKLGCVFTQTSVDDEGQPMRDPDSTTYVGTFEDCRHVGSLLRAEALRRGLASAQRTVYLGDGAPWIWENARINFPDAEQILDFYHASEHAGDLAAALLDAGPEAKAQQSRWSHQMKEDSSEPIIAHAKALLVERLPNLAPERIESINREIAYFQTNASRTRYGYFRQQGYFIGSGVIEAGCKTVVGRRLKQSGMFWSQRGGDHLLTLRCMTLGPSFTQIWNARIPILTAKRAKQPRWSASN